MLGEQGNQAIIVWGEYGGGYANGAEYPWDNQQVLKEVWNNNYITQKY